MATAAPLARKNDYKNVVWNNNENLVKLSKQLNLKWCEDHFKRYALGRLLFSFLSPSLSIPFYHRCELNIEYLNLQQMRLPCYSQNKIPCIQFWSVCTMYITRNYKRGRENRTLHGKIEPIHAKWFSFLSCCCWKWQRKIKEDLNAKIRCIQLSGLFCAHVN